MDVYKENGVYNLYMRVNKVEGPPKTHERELNEAETDVEQPLGGPWPPHQA